MTAPESANAEGEGCPPQQSQHTSTSWTQQGSPHTTPLLPEWQHPDFLSHTDFVPEYPTCLLCCHHQITQMSKQHRLKDQTPAFESQACHLRDMWVQCMSSLCAYFPPEGSTRAFSTVPTLRYFCSSEFISTEGQDKKPDLQQPGQISG